MANASSSNAVQRIPALSLSVLILVCVILLLFNYTFQTDLQKYKIIMTYSRTNEKNIKISSFSGSKV